MTEYLALSQLVGRSYITELLLHHFHFPLSLPTPRNPSTSPSPFPISVLSSCHFGLFFSLSAAFGQARPGRGLELVECTKRFQKADRLNHRLTAHKDLPSTGGTSVPSANNFICRYVTEIVPLLLRLCTIGMIYDIILR